MHLVFRYDDFSAAERQPFEVDLAVFDLFASLNIPLVVGVTPCMSRQARDPVNKEFHLFEADTRRVALLTRHLQLSWQLALHGYTHQRDVVQDETEFQGVSREVQSAKIADGRAALQRSLPNAVCAIFIPPWNSFDEVTLDCLAEQGFRVVCAGDNLTPRQRDMLLVVPSLMATRDLVDYVRHYGVPHLLALVGDAHLIVTMHEYEFRLSERANFVALSELEAVLRDLLSAGVVCGNLPIEGSENQFQPRHACLLRANLRLLQYARARRKLALILWRLAKAIDLRLGLPRTCPAKSLAAVGLWLCDSGLRPLLRR